MTGGDGADVFVFSTALGGCNVDLISDYAQGIAKIRLVKSAGDTPFSALDPGHLSAGTFKLLGGGMAVDADDRILYDQARGRLFYDADGSGAIGRVLFALVEPGLLIRKADFLIS